MIVRDPAVIKAYMRKVEEQKLEYYMNHPEAIKRTGNAEEDALQQVAYVTSLRRGASIADFVTGCKPE